MVGVPPKTVTPTQPTINTPIAITGTTALTAGDALSLTVTPSLSSGTGSFTYQWKKGGTNLTNGSGVSGATTANLKIASVASSDAGSYTVVVTETTASNSPVTSTTAAVTVAPVLTALTYGSGTATVGGTTASPTATLSLASDGTSGKTVTVSPNTGAKIGSYTATSSDATALTVTPASGNITTADGKATLTLKPLKGTGTINVTVTSGSVSKVLVVTLGA